MLPTLFISHGGGPGFFLKSEPGSPFKDFDQTSPFCKALTEVGKNKASYGLPEKPDAIVIISAHWEESDIHVYAKPNPTLFYDYYGFPPHTYELNYPAPGDEKLAQRIVQMINDSPVDEAKFQKKLKAELDYGRPGFDHGVFIPLLLLYPNADVPIVQVSLKSNRNPLEHYSLGKILSPLRSENILIIGSGQATHPMSGGFSTDPKLTEQFIDYVENGLFNQNMNETERLTHLLAFWKDQKMIKLMKATHNPGNEHFIPLLVALGAVNGASSKNLFKVDKDFRAAGGSFSMACYIFDDVPALRLDRC